LTHENDSLVSSLAVNPAEDFWFTGAAGVKVQGFIVKPPNWQAGKKYPAILLITAVRKARGSISGTAAGITRCSRRLARRSSSSTRGLVRLRPAIRG
jgi:hypothetical protein